jgi:hypothetical protein
MNHPPVPRFPNNHSPDTTKEIQRDCGQGCQIKAGRLIIMLMTRVHTANTRLKANTGRTIDAWSLAQMNKGRRNNADTTSVVIGIFSLCARDISTNAFSSQYLVHWFG